MVVMMFSNDAWGALALLGGGEREKRRHTYMIVQELKYQGDICSSYSVVQ